MKNKSIIWILLLILLISNMIPIILSYKTFSNKIIYVDDDGTSDYTRIQDAIDNSSDGDTIYVYSGNYDENIVIEKSITLIGENRNNTIIQGDDINNTVTITSNFVDISGFNISISKLEN